MSALITMPKQPVLAWLTTPVSKQCVRCNGWIDAGFGRAAYAWTNIGACCQQCVFDPLEVA